MYWNLTDGGATLNYLAANIRITETPTPNPKNQRMGVDFLMRKNINQVVVIKL